MFTTTSLIIGAIAAFLIGLSKSAVPGAGLLAVPLLAAVVSGRGVAGTMLPMLLIADVLAVRWYGNHSRNDVLRPLIAPVAAGFVAGTAFFMLVGAAGRTLEIILGAIIVALVGFQLYRTALRSPLMKTSPTLSCITGFVGGFTSFVANASGPVLNTYIVALGLSKNELIGTSAWFYFIVNAAKIPIYLGLMYLTPGGAFFTSEYLLFDAVLSPLVITGALIGRPLLRIIPQNAFNNLVLVLSGIAALKLIAGV